MTSYCSYAQEEKLSQSTAVAFSKNTTFNTSSFFTIKQLCEIYICRTLVVIFGSLILFAEARSGCV